MKLIIKNSFLGKHVFDENGKEVCQISSHLMNLTQNILLIDQQKTYVSAIERVGKEEKLNSKLMLHIMEDTSQQDELLGNAIGNSEAKLYERSYHELNVEDKRMNLQYFLHLNSDTSWHIEDHQHHKLGSIKRMDAYGNIQLECNAINDLLLLCSFYIFTRYLMKENEMIMV